MKQLITLITILFISLLTSPSWGQTVSMDELVMNPTDNLVYKKFTSVPFTGFAKMTYTPYGFGPFDPQQSAKWYTLLRLHDNSCYQYVGCVSKGSYKKGKKHGLWETFYKTGLLREIEHFKDGKKHGVWEEYYGTGLLSFRVHFIDGKKDGLSETYHSNGMLRFIGNYKDGKSEGLWTNYYNNGHFSNKTNYKDGKRDGLKEEFNEDGSLIKTETYKDGELVE